MTAQVIIYYFFSGRNPTASEDAFREWVFRHICCHTPLDLVDHGLVQNTGLTYYPDVLIHLSQNEYERLCRCLEMRKILKNHEDFKNEKPKVIQFLESKLRGTQHFSYQRLTQRSHRQPFSIHSPLTRQLSTQRCQFHHHRQRESHIENTPRHITNTPYPHCVTQSHLDSKIRHSREHTKLSQDV